jgi:hypothetical protein
VWGRFDRGGQQAETNDEHRTMQAFPHACTPSCHEDGQIGGLKIPLKTATAPHHARDVSRATVELVVSERNQ